MTTKINSTRKIVRIFLIILAVLIFLFCVLVIAVSSKKNTNNFFNGVTLYYYYTQKESSMARASTVAQNQQDVGGAGFILEQESLYICACVYANKNDAESIKNKNFNVYNESGVIEQKTQKITTKLKKVLNNDNNLLNLLNYLEKGFYNLSELINDYEKQNCQKSQFLNSVFVIKTNLYDYAFLVNKDYQLFTEPIINALDDGLISSTKLQMLSKFRLATILFIEAFNNICSVTDGL